MKGYIVNVVKLHPHVFEKEMYNIARHYSESELCFGCYEDAYNELLATATGRHRAAETLFERTGAESAARRALEAQAALWKIENMRRN